jgi:hypothetical protein
LWEREAAVLRDIAGDVEDHIRARDEGEQAHRAARAQLT